jgi:pyruvate/2-oxoglutarate dehydrogenase complex dihydrolipoamide acyltransferase (E2) component
MHGFLDLDVTDAARLVEAHEPPLSFTAFVIASVARAAAAHPEVHAYKNWRGRLVTHQHVDVSTLIEIPTEQGPFPMVHTVRDADIRDVADLSADLRAVKARPAATRHSAGTRIFRLATHVPGLIRAMYAVISRSVRVRQRSGTITVSAVGMFAEGGGFAVAPLTLMSLQVIVGGISERPRVVEGRIGTRTVLELSITIDHNVVDGGPATRFGADLRRQIESAACLR